jgi:hypothetical protein
MSTEALKASLSANFFDTHKIFFCRSRREIQRALVALT